MNSSGFQCDLPDHLTGYIHIYIYLIVLLQTSECHFPQAPKESSQKGPANCFGAPNPPCQWIVLPGFQETNDFFWGLRYPFTHDTVDGTASSHSAERCFISYLFLKGKG